MMNLNTYSTELIDREGILFAKKKSEISYPESGNDNFFQFEDNSFWFKHRNNCIIEAVKKYCPDDHFFDIGGGNGFVAKGLENAGIKTILVEPGIKGCLNAKKRTLKHIICSTLENAEFKNNSIPAAGLFDVVEHIEDDLGFLESTCKFLKKDGFLFVTVPAYNALFSQEDEDVGHYRRYTIKSISDVLQQAGFKIEYATYVFSILPIPVFLFRTLPGKLGIPIKTNDLEQQKKDHNLSGGIVNSTLDKIWNFELNRIKNGKTIPIGGSCFVVARK